MGVEGHTGAIRAFELEQGNVVLPALAVVLPVDDDALGGEAALKVIPLHRVVVTQPHHIAGRVSTEPGKVQERGRERERDSKEERRSRVRKTKLLEKRKTQRAKLSLATSGGGWGWECVTCQHKHTGDRSDSNSRVNRLSAG